MNNHRSAAMSEPFIGRVRHLEAVAEVIKERFGNLTVSETISLAGKIINAVEKADEESNGSTTRGPRSGSGGR